MKETSWYGEVIPAVLMDGILKVVKFPVSIPVTAPGRNRTAPRVTRIEFYLQSFTIRDVAFTQNSARYWLTIASNT